MPPRDAGVGKLFVLNPSTEKMEELVTLSDTDIEDDRINDNVIDPKEDRWFDEGGTVEFTLKPVEVIDVNAEEIKND